jgi:hypothetical protein
MKFGADFWAVHLAAIERDGLTVSAYGKSHGISAATLYHWKRKLAIPGDVGMVKASLANKFVSLRVADATAEVRSNGCTLVLAPGIRLELSELPAPAWLATLARAAQGAV